MLNTHGTLATYFRSQAERKSFMGGILESLDFSPLQNQSITNADLREVIRDIRLDFDQFSARLEQADLKLLALKKAHQSRMPSDFFASDGEAISHWGIPIPDQKAHDELSKIGHEKPKVILLPKKRFNQ